MARNSLMVLYDDVSWANKYGNPLVDAFLRFASTSNALKACTFVPISKFYDDPHAYRHHMRVSGLAFRFYGAITPRVTREEIKQRDEFWSRMDDDSRIYSTVNYEEYMAYCRREEKAAHESVDVVQKALTQWTQRNNVPGPRRNGEALIVHVCSIINLDEFTDKITEKDVARAFSLTRDNSHNDIISRRWARNVPPVGVESMAFILAAKKKAVEPRIYQTIEERNQEQAELLDTDYPSSYAFDRRIKPVNDSAETLQQMISVGLVETDPYNQGLLGSGAQRQDPDTHWNKFIGRGQYDPRLFLEIWKFVYSPPDAASASAPAADTPESAKDDD